jgi:GDP-L-fucose synthase
VRESSKIYVAGGAATMEGAALLRQLHGQGYTNVIGQGEGGPDLRDPSQVSAFFRDTSPEYVFLAGGRSGGIRANQSHPVDLMRDNLLVNSNVLEAAAGSGVTRLLYLAASCCYPRECPQPMRVDRLFTGPLEPTNEAYATAKLAGIVLCNAYRQQHGMDFIVGIPANPFGPGDDFDLQDGHVIPALMRRMLEAQDQGLPSVEVWGSGRPQREFIFAEDLADACIFVMLQYKGTEPINLGGGSALAIGELAELIREVVGYSGELRFDTARPDGMPMKMLDSTPLLGMGWRPTTPLRSALAQMHNWLLANRCDGSVSKPDGILTL